MENLPRKLELLNCDVMSINLHHKKIMTNSLAIAQYFGKRPSDVNKRIKALVKKRLCKIAPSYYINQQGKKQSYYELNRDQYLLIALGFTGNKAEQLKINIIKLINQLEAELIKWQTGKLTACTATKQANDELMWLQTELEKVIPTSKRCTMLFTHVQLAINKAVTGKGKKIDRKTLSTNELDNITNLEELVQAQILSRKEKGLDPEIIRNEILQIIRKEEPTRRAVLT